jgi:hypothetical protein
MPPIYKVVFLLDPDDEARHESVRALDAPEARVVIQPGTYPEKINAGAAATDEPWVLCGADDLHFHPGWWEAAMAAVEIVEVQIEQSNESFELPGSTGVIGTNDLHMEVKQEHFSTHPLVARWYIDQFGTADELGKVMHEGYHHNQVDVELCLTARARGLYVFAADSHVEHRHAVFTGAAMDDTHRRGMLSGNTDDQALLASRRSLWSQ